MSVMIALQPTAGPALVVGGGAVAARKVRSLAEGEFQVVVIAPDVLEEITLAPFVTVHRRAFEPADLQSDARYALVFACTNHRETNRLVGQLARAANIPVVVTDSQPESTFFSPAVIRDGDLLVGVSTGGASPSLARVIRERIVAALAPGWAHIVHAARKEREERLAARQGHERQPMDTKE